MGKPTAGEVLVNALFLIEGVEPQLDKKDRKRCVSIAFAMRNLIGSLGAQPTLNVIKHEAIREILEGNEITQSILEDAASTMSKAEDRDAVAHDIASARTRCPHEKSYTRVTGHGESARVCELCGESWR